jgi:hypothetical protein
LQPVAALTETARGGGGFGHTGLRGDHAVGAGVQAP